MSNELEIIHFDEKDHARFWSKVDRKGPDECWLWTAGRRGARDLGWYGAFKFKKLMRYAHRVAFCLGRGYPVLGYLTDDTAVMHTCDTPLCCNPAHHALGTQPQNVRDMIQKSRDRSSRRRNASTQEIPV